MRSVITYGTDAANMLFHVVNERHRRKRAMIFTTNKSLKGWGRVLHDEDLAQAIIDRVLERGRLVRLDGPSIRTLHVNLDETLNEGSDQDHDLARISGIQRAEFPEPTVGRHPHLWSIIGPPRRRSDDSNSSNRPAAIEEADNLTRRRFLARVAMCAPTFRPRQTFNRV